MTRNEIESVLKEKADQSSMYDRTIIDQKLSEKATIADLSLKADLTALELKADKALVYTTGQLFTRDQIQSLLSTKSDASAVYDQSTIDSKLSEKADLSALNLKADADSVYTRGQLMTQSQIQNSLNQKADISDIYTRTIVDTLCSQKADTSRVYTRVFLDSLLSQKAEIAKIYTRTAIDNALSQKADVVQIYTRSTLDSKLLQKADYDQIYTRANLDNALSQKADVAHIYTRSALDNSLSQKADQSSLDLKANITDIYSRTNIDEQMAQKADKTDLNLKADVSLLPLKADKADIYTRNQLYTRSEMDETLSKLPTQASMDLKANVNEIYTINQLLTKTELSQNFTTVSLTTTTLTFNQIPIIATGNEINYLTGVNANIQSQINILETTLNTKADDNNVLKKDGSVSLTADWDAGNATISARQMASTVASGTSPLKVNSSTLVSNLNADLLDNKHAPNGDIVGTTDDQTLENKTMSSPSLYTPSIFDGSIDNTTIGLTKPASAKFTSVSTDSLSVNDVSVDTTKITYLNSVTSNIQNQLDSKANDSEVLKKDASISLTANWDAGNYLITAKQFKSDVSTGTAPLVVSSSTKVDLLNADLLDGKHAPTSGDIVGTTSSQTLTNKTLTSPTISSPNISGGSLNNTTIGVNTPSSGNFTTLSASGQTTLNGATNTGNLKTSSLTLNNVNITANGNEINYLDGVTSSIQTQLNSKASGTDTLKKDGTTSLINDWNTGNYKITAKNFHSSASTGTSPLIVSSTTKVSNLNADLLDGKNSPGGDIVGTTDSQTLTNKTLTSPILNTPVLNNPIVKGSDSLSFEGSTDNNFETRIAVVDPTTDRTITIPNTTGTVVVTSDGNISGSQINASEISSNHIADNAITESKIINNAVSENKLNTGAVTENKIAVNAVTENKIATNAVTGTKIADNSISESKIVNSAVTTNKIADNSVSQTKIVDSAVSESKIAISAVTENKVATSAITENKIATNAVTGTKIADNSISESKIVNSAVTTNKIADNSVSQAKIIDSAVTESKIATNAVTGTKIADNSVSESKIVNNAVTTNKIADYSVSEAKLINSAVTTNKIADNAITDAKLNISHLSVQTATISNSLTTDTGKLNDLTVSGNASIQTSTINALTINNVFTINNSTIASSASQARTITLPDTSGFVVITEDGTIPDSSITTSKMANSAVTTDKVANSAITTVKITDNAIISSKIADNAILSNHIANGSITSADIATTAIAYTHLSNAIITAPILAGSGNAAMTNGISGQRLISNGDGTFSWANPFTITDGSITFAKIEAGAISESTLADNAITENKITDRAITENKIATSAVTETKIADNSVSESKIVNSAVTTNKIADYSVSEAKMITGAVTTSKIADNSITDVKLNVTNLSVQTATISSSLTTDTGKLNALTVSGNASIQTSTINSLTINNVFKISDSTITTSASQARTITLPDTSGFVVITEDGSIPDSSITTSKMANSAVTTDKVANSAITTVKITDNAIISSKIADNAILSNHIANGSITSADIATTAIAYTHLSNAIITAPILAGSGNAAMTNGISGQRLISNGDGTFSWANPFTITDGSITFAKIEAGAISESTLADNAITENKITDRAITENKIATSAVTETKIADNSVSESKIVNSAVTTNKIADYSVSEAKMITGAVTTSKIADNSITDVKLNVTNLSVQTATISSSLTTDTGKLNALTVSGNASIQTSTINSLTINNVFKISDSTITTSASQARTITLPDTSGFVVITEDGSIPDSSITTSKIANSAVTTDKVADSAITTVKIIDNAITSAKIADNSILSNHIANGSVISMDIAPTAIGYTHLSNAVITTPILAGSGNVAMTNGSSGQRLVSNGDGTFSWADSFTITDGSITFAKIEAGAVSESTLADNAITVNKIADNAITENKIADNAITDAKLNITNLSVQTATISSSLTADNGQLNALTVSGNASIQTSTINALTINNVIKISDSTIASSASQARTITLPDTSGFVVITEDGSIPDSSITSSKIAYSAVTSDKVADNAITTVKIIDNAITSVKIADNSISSNHIVNASITSIDIAPTAIAYTHLNNAIITAPKLAASGNAAMTNGDSGQRLVSNGDGTFSWASPFTITDGSISFAKIEAGAISESALADNAITTNKIADNAITDAKLNVTNLSVQTATISASITAGAAQLTALTVSGNASFQTSTFNTLTINNTFKMNDLTITTSTSQARAITFPDRSGFVVVTEDGNITATMLAGSGNIAMTNGTSGQNLVSNADGSFSWADAFTITDGYITSAKIADGSITASDIASKAINYTQIAEGGIKAINLSGVSDNGTDGQCLSSNGDGTFSWSSDSENISAISTDTTLTTTQQGVILARNAIALTLPDASSASVARFTIKNIDSANTVRVAGDIDGQSEMNLSFQYAYIEVISNGTAWYIVAQHPLMDISPPTPGNNGTIEIGSFTADSATLSWVVSTDSQSNNLEYRVYTSTTSFENTVTAWESNGTAVSNWIANTNGYVLTDLSPQKTYTVTVLSRDESGNKALYTDETFTIVTTNTTLTSSQEGRILASGSIVLTLPDPSSANGIHYTITNIDNTNTVSISGNMDNDRSELNLNFQDAYVELASNGTNWYTVDVHPLIDLMDPVPGDNGTLHTSAITGESASLTWIVSTDNQTNSNNLVYRVYQSTTSIENTVQAWVNSATSASDWIADTNTYNITGLSDNTQYTINVIVKDEAGNKAIYSSQSFTTLISNLNATGWPKALAYSPDGTTIAVVDSYGTVELLNTLNGNIISSVDCGWGSHSVDFSPDGTMLAVGSASSPYPVYLLNVPGLSTIAEMTGHTSGHVYDVKFSHDGSILASLGHDTTIRLWDVTSQSHIRTLTGLTYIGYDMDFSPDDTMLASGDARENIVIWDVSTGNQLQTMTGKDDIHSVAFNHDGTVLATGEKTYLELWDTSNGTRIGDAINNVVYLYDTFYNSDSTRLYTLSSTQMLNIWDTSNMSVIKTIETYYVDTGWRAKHMAISPDMSTIAAQADGKQNIKLYYDIDSY
jgi:WD40 repeat protein